MIPTCKMTTMPVVWCNDPNSVNNKPLAFTLHGIQLQGNVTEQQVLALHELVNAAAEGRLILPANGTFVLMDNSISLDSTIVVGGKQVNAEKENVNATFEEETTNSKYQLMPVTQMVAANTSVDNNVFELKAENTKVDGNEENMYGFLCCARSMKRKSKDVKSSDSGYIKSDAHCPHNGIRRRRMECYLRKYYINSSHKSIFPSQLQHEDHIYSIAKRCQRSKHRKNYYRSSKSMDRNRHQTSKLPIQSHIIFHNRFIFNTSSTNKLGLQHAQQKSNDVFYSKRRTIEKRISLTLTDKLQCQRTRAIIPQNIRQRKIGSVVGGLNHSVQVESRILANNGNNKDWLQYETNNCCDILNPAVDMQDLISFEDIVDEVKQPMASVNKAEATIMDILTSSKNELSTVDFELDPDWIKADNNPENNLVPPVSAPTSPRSTTSSRKTSFDSTSTISSMDSGFIEIQTKLENSLLCIKSMKPDNIEENCSKLSLSNYKECLKQSKNRRRSYEEFKAISSGLNVTHSTKTDNNNKSLDGVQEVSAAEELSKTTNALRRMLLELGKSEKQIDSNLKINNSTSTETTSTAECRKPNAFLIGNLESILEQEPRVTRGPMNTLVDITNSHHNYNYNNSSNMNENNNSKNVQSNSSLDNTKPDCKNKFVVTKACEVDSAGVDIVIGQTIQKTSEIDTYTIHDICTTSNLSISSPTTIIPTSATTVTTAESIRKNSDILSQILNQEVLPKEKEKVQLRRKSYEEFKRLVRESEFAVNDNSSTSELKRQNSRHRKSSTSFSTMRRNLAKESNKDGMNNKTQSSSEKLQSEELLNQKISMASYKRNFKIYDKLIYGTIYDIIQRNNLTCKKYDKYMTYGTIYEILHRKSSQTSLDSSSVNSYTDLSAYQGKSLSTILTKSSLAIAETNSKLEDIEKIKNSGFIYDIIRKHHYQQQQKKLVAGCPTATETTNLVSRKYGTIYDILQGEKSESSNSRRSSIHDNHKSQNRFTVSKIDETHVQTGVPLLEAAKREDPVKPLQITVENNQLPNNSSTVENKITKHNKMRRLSNILNYKSNSAQLKYEKSVESKKNSAETSKGLVFNNQLLPLDSEELYAHITAKNREATFKNFPYRPPNKPIVKSNSLDAISTTAAVSPPNTPSPPRPRRSLKQHTCHTQTPSRRPKKISVDDIDSAIVLKGQRNIQQRRWSNLLLSKCHCAAEISSSEIYINKLSHYCPNCATQVLRVNRDNCVCLVCKNKENPFNVRNFNNNQDQTTESKTVKKNKSRRLSEFTRGEFLNEKP